jgi:hypothetical protein
MKSKLLFVTEFFMLVKKEGVMHRYCRFGKVRIKISHMEREKFRVVFTRGYVRCHIEWITAPTRPEAMNRLREFLETPAMKILANTA